MEEAITIKWDEATRKQWDAHLDTLPYAAYQQHHAYGDVIRRMGGMVHRARIFDGKTCIGLAQVHTKRIMGCLTVATIMLGPVWLDELLAADIKAITYRALCKTIPVEGAHIFLLMPNAANADAEKTIGLKRIISNYHTVLLDLTKDEAALLAAMHGKWRNRLRVAEKSALRVSTVGRRPVQYSWLLEKETQQRRRLGYNALSTGVVPLYQEIAGKDSVFTLEAKEGKMLLGGMLFLCHGNAATYHIGWASDVGRERNAHNVLLWHAMQQLKKKGIQRIDLGGVDTDHLAGIARFKLGAGGDLISQSGIWCLKPNLY